ncbi:hypothetical protein [Novosphingobium clariflavum]|uniref:Uncharacterized protein n=1 Tax=Novosphingobium clariflavum TaxID=2029884 RepID=A0ABV6S4G8_9SPHN|nr:hypothetical protein [Novosphingobium clariflavum]
MIGKLLLRHVFEELAETWRTVTAIKLCVVPVATLHAFDAGPQAIPAMVPNAFGDLVPIARLDDLSAFAALMGFTCCLP